MEGNEGGVSRRGERERERERVLCHVVEENVNEFGERCFKCHVGRK